MTAVYKTTISHLRLSPVKHAFTYSSYWWLVDLDALPNYGPLASFRATDHVGSGPSLRANIDALLTAHGLACQRVLMLCNPRVLGHVFNPLSLHYCLGADDSLVAVVAEVHNTYGGRHAYVMQTDATSRASTDKEFYVSPFHQVDGSYHMRLPPPGQSLRVDLTYAREEAKPFVVTVRGTRVAVRQGDILLAAVRHPLVTRLVALRIRTQGVRLWLRRVPVVPRPTAGTSTSPFGHRTPVTSNREHAA